MEAMVEAKGRKGRATHKGSCQGCGSVQMLPNGVLAKHGYTVEWGFFSGVCQGSGWKPFETHTDLIEGFIARAEALVEEKEEFITKLLQKPTEARGWVKVYRTARNRYERSGSYWHEVEFTMHQGKYDTKPRAHYANPHKAGELLDCYSHAITVDWTIRETATILDYVAAANGKRADAVRAEVEEIRKYIAWQRKRLAEWKEEPLTPR